MVDYKEKLHVSPTLFFLAGVIYYFFLPPLALYFFQDSIQVARASLWVRPEQYDIYYYIDGFVIVLSWMLGRYISFFLIRPKLSGLDVVASMVKGGWLLFLFMLGVFLLNLVSVVSSGASLFSGYEEYDVLVLGPFATVAFVSISLRNFFLDAKVRFGFFLIFLGATLILLGLGSRMLVMIAITSAMIEFYYRHKVKGRSLFLFISAALLVVVFMLIVGVVRDGGDVDVQSVIGIFIAEPLFTSIGSIRYFIFTDGRPYFNFPFDVVAGFVNFVPSIIFPQKVEIFELLGGLDWNYSPFGASALLVNLYKNFGMAYPIFIMGLAAYFTFLQINSRISGLYRSIYFSCLPLLLFYVHREGFVTVIKVLLFNGLILPVVLIAVLKFLTDKPDLEDRRPNV